MITMGLLNQVLKLFRGEPKKQTTQGPYHGEYPSSNRDTEVEAVGLSDGSIEDRVNIEHDGTQYYCQVEESSNGQYQVAYADGRVGQDEPVHGAVFLFEDGVLNFTVKIERPNEVAVSNTGVVVVVDWEFGWGEGGLSGTFHVFSPSGSRELVETFESNLGPCTVTSDGRYAAASTLNPDCSTYLFDVESGKYLASHENEDGNKQKLVFETVEGEVRLGLADALRDEPAYAIDLSGDLVWRNEKNNLRGDVGELVGQLQQTGADRTVTKDLCAISRQNPSEITEYLPELLNLLEDGMFVTTDDQGGNINVSANPAFTSVAKTTPTEYKPHLDRLIDNVRVATTPAAAVVSTRVLAELAKQDLESLTAHHGDVINLLQHDSLDARRRAITIIEADAGRMYDHTSSLADQLCERLRSEDDLALLCDITSALTTLVNERPDAVERVGSVVPRVIELLSIGDTDYQYGDVETYDYKDQTHYDTNHLHRAVPRLIAALTPKYAERFSDAIPVLLNMLRQPGQRNTNLRNASHQALSAIAIHSARAPPALEAEFAQIVRLLDHADKEIRMASVGLLVALGTEDAREKLSELQETEDTELASAAKRGIQTIEMASPLDPEVTELTPPGSDAIEQIHHQYEIQRAFEYLQSEGSARKQMFIDVVYTEDSRDDPDAWWRMIRAGLKSIETVELSGNTYSFTG